MEGPLLGCAAFFLACMVPLGIIIWTQQVVKKSNLARLDDLEVSRQAMPTPVKSCPLCESSTLEMVTIDYVLETRTSPRVYLPVTTVNEARERLELVGVRCQACGYVMPFAVHKSRFAL